MLSGVLSVTKVDYHCPQSALYLINQDCQFMKLLIQGAQSPKEIPGLQPLPKDINVVCAADEASMIRELRDAEILLGWNFRSDELKKHWDNAEKLKWIHWCGAGVDAALFPELRNSDVILSNARGIFDRAMAETLLGYILMVAKDFRTTLEHQKSKTWEHRISRCIKGDRVLIVGVGSIGREFSRVLTSMGMKCSGAGRSGRSGDRDFLEILDSTDLASSLNTFEWVIGIMPSTAETRGFFDRIFFDNMSSNAHFVNMGRGNAVVEEDIIEALESGKIAGAMLDVFCNEPLEQTDPLWNVQNLFISPHISGDFLGFQEAMINLFKCNLEKFMVGEKMDNIVDKKLGFVK
jgi:phosphoglycerate dehydrogenase-like enzyme